MEDQYLLEEYRLIKARIESNEHRRHQVLVLCVTASATALGLGEKIGSGLVPFLIGGLVLMASAVNTIYMTLQAFATAFLAKRVETRFQRMGFETTYASVTHSGDQSLWHKVKSRPLGFVSDPFVVLTLFSISASIVFGWNFVTQGSISSTSAAFYVLGLVVLHVLIIDTLVERRRKGLRWFGQRLETPTAVTEGGVSIKAEEEGE